MYPGISDSLTVADIAEHLRLSPGHVRRLLIAGVLHGEKAQGPGRWINPPWQVERSEFEAALREGRVVAGGKKPGPKSTPAAPWEAGVRRGNMATEFQMIVEKQPEGFRGNPQVYHWDGSGWYAPVQLNGETHFYHIGNDPDVRPDARGYGTPGWVEDPPEAANPE